MSDVRRLGLLEELLSNEAIERVKAADRSQPISITITNSTVNILCQSPHAAAPEPTQ